MDGSAGYRIGMNLTPLSWRGGGMRHYVVQLIPWLLRLSAHHLVVFYSAQGLGVLAPMLRALPLPLRRRIELIAVEQWEQIYGYADRFDVYFCPLQCLAPRLLDRPTLATLADVQDQYFPQYFTKQQLELRKQFYPTTVRSVTVLLTISEFSKDCVCDCYGVEREKVIVTHLAPSDDVVHSEPIWPANLPRLPERYLFYPANLYPHKGHELLLQTVKLLHRRGHRLACVMTGCPATPGADIRSLIQRYELEEHAFWYGHLPPAALRHLYASAAALVFPSEFEGFGMPLVEAMYSDCPVIATAQASIPEIVGDAGLLVERTPEALADAIIRVVGDPGERKRLVALGRLQAQKFTSKALAERTLEAIETAVSRFSAEVPVASAPVSYVVEPAEGGPRLLQTMSSLVYEIRPEDELRILARRDQVSMPVRMLCDNLPIEPKFVPKSAAGGWLDGLAGTLVCYLREGEELCEGASTSMRSAFADPACQAAVGETIVADSTGRFLCHRFVADQLESRLASRQAPGSAAFWRIELLRARRERLAEGQWPAGVLAELPIERIRRLNRTIAIERQPAAVPGPAAVAPAAPPMNRWVLVKHHIRAAARRLSPRFEAWLHGFYVGKVRGLVRKQGVL